MRVLKENHHEGERVDVTICIAEDDEGHADLILRNLERVGIWNEILHFEDGQEILNFLEKAGNPPFREEGKAYLVLLDIRMPKVDGIEVLRRIKESEELKSLPVIMLTTTDDPQEVKLCHDLGCNNYIVKPVEPRAFVAAIQRMGLFLKIVRVPTLEAPA